MLIRLRFRNNLFAFLFRSAKCFSERKDVETILFKSLA